MSPSDPINMIRIEGEARLFGFVGLVWSLVNSSYIHINEFGNRNVECGNIRKDNIRLFTINSGSNLALLAAFQ
jgi:hypothetical protein